MKKPLLFIIFAFIIHAGIYAQSCLPDGIIFSTQLEIDNFQTNYPTCTEIEGAVKISGSNITNLEGLNNILSIGGHLTIEYCDSLTNLVGLSNLNLIEGGLIANSNSMLTSLQGLENINKLSLIYLSYNWPLINFEGLNNLDSIDGYLYMDNNGLVDFSGLENLKIIGGSFDSYWNNDLISFSGLENLESIGDYFWIQTNYNLEDMSSLSNLESIGGSLVIIETNLSSLTGLENVDPSSISAMSIYSNGNLYECEVESICNYLTSPNGKVQIYNNADGCNTPPEIASACGNIMNCLPYGDYFFNNQNSIDNFQTDYPSCSSLSGNVTIMNYEIANLNGLIPIKSISGDLIIFKTFNLISLEGLDSLTSIGKTLFIGGYDIWPYYFEANSKLADISALMNLKHVGYGLTVKYNPKLASLIGLDSIKFEGGNEIEIGDNDILSFCNVFSICDCLAGNCNSEIYSNTYGCNNEEEVEAACLVSTPEIKIKPEYILYPNPASRSISVLNEDNMIIDKVIIYNQLGNIVLTTTGKTDNIDISKIEKGIYIVEITTMKSSIWEKLIIK